MGDTFGGTWNRPGSNGRDRQRGHSKGDVQYLASYDNEPQSGCGALFFACLTILAALAAVLGVVLG